MSQVRTDEKPIVITVGEYRVELPTIEAAHDFLDEGSRRHAVERSGLVAEKSTPTNALPLLIKANRTPKPQSSARTGKPRPAGKRAASVDLKADAATRRQWFHKKILRTKKGEAVARRIASSADGVTGPELAVEIFGGARKEVWRALDTLKDKAKQCGFLGEADVVKAEPEGNAKRYRPGPALEGFGTADRA